MTTWQPSEGLKRADAVVAEIEQAMEACGVVPPDGMPMRAVLGHRLTEIVANAIDAATGARKTASIHVNHTNGHHPSDTVADFVTREPPTKKDEAYFGARPKRLSSPGIPDGATVSVAGGPHAGTYVTAVGSDAAPVKKRGRPKGSTKKAKKPAKGDKAPEAPPAAE